MAGLSDLCGVLSCVDTIMKEPPERTNIDVGKHFNIFIFDWPCVTVHYVCQHPEDAAKGDPDRVYFYFLSGHYLAAYQELKEQLVDHEQIKRRCLELGAETNQGERR